MMTIAEKARMEEMTRRVAELEHAHDFTLRGLKRLEGVPLEDRERVKLELNEAFGALSESHPVWLAFNKLLAIHIATEHRAARDPGLSNDGRNLQLGRESGLEDFRAACWQIFARTRMK